jgi:hypothetical protein
MSALPSKAEMLTTGVDVRYVAEADIRKRHPDQRGDRGMGNGGGYFFAQCGLYCRQPICGKVRSRQRRAQTRPKGWKMLWQFTVGVSAKGKADRIVVHAEDALVAALKVKTERPTATIMYVRRLNRRGDTRHPPHTLTGGDN